MNNKVKKYVDEKCIKAQQWLVEQAQETKELLQNKDGISHTTEVLLWSAGAAAVVLVAIGLFVVLLKTDVFPKLGTKLQEIFNFK
ncbi:hypothetical protein RBG61_06515 [Paludicola sp. MB14-C6]|uniref:hypothetical protein n=1 Tax=Paludihabitans sp. MB14-C6 TaxID=3070656 RepID=UPI0027DC60ED|nr:hypothetical protein [Paludicola sp. MB14-C6]WMJ24314.1 hypothetical protein RBG61_06515 [Paludicola sp. MB14-C6]